MHFPPFFQILYDMNGILDAARCLSEGKELLSIHEVTKCLLKTLESKRQCFQEAIPSSVI